MSPFVVHAKARVPALQRLLAHLPAQSLALSQCANIAAVVLDGCLAEPALLLVLGFLELLAALAQMVGRGLALDAEVTSTLGAAHSELAHVLGRRLGDCLAVFLLHLDDLALDHLNQVAAGALDQVEVVLEGSLHALLV